MVEEDHGWMRRALALAGEGWGQTAPNPMVGAVVVDASGNVAGEGAHARYGGAHAEIVALRAAGERSRGGTMYVTLEPCVHHGKTPPCVPALLASGIARVVIAALDPNPPAAGGAESLRAAGVDVTLGVEGSAARELNAPFFHALSSDIPWITLKLALSIDGAIAPGGGSRRWLTGEASRRAAHRLRAGNDAIAVGSGTVIIDDPLLTVREFDSPRVAPVRVVFDRRLRIPDDSALVAGARETPLLLVTAPDHPRKKAEHLEAMGVEFIVCEQLRGAMEELRGRGIRSLLVEGGAQIAGALIGAGLAHRLVIFQAPVLLGEGALNAFSRVPPAAALELSRLPVIERRALEDDSMTVYGMDTAGVHRAD
jgi:diaminohydroxyphosphoribosylaminopyrimidine deaminase/5-amino-6-(5-phosphoribosylamino)uracil reductase